MFRWAGLSTGVDDERRSWTVHEPARSAAAVAAPTPSVRRLEYGSIEHDRRGASHERATRALKTQLLMLVASPMEEISHPFRLYIAREKHIPMCRVHVMTFLNAVDSRLWATNNAQHMGGVAQVREWVFPLMLPLSHSGADIALNLCVMQYGAGTKTMFDETAAEARMLPIAHWHIGDADVDHARGGAVVEIANRVPTNTACAHLAKVPDFARTYSEYAVGRITFDLESIWDAVWPILDRRAREQELSSEMLELVDLYRRACSSVHTK